MYQLFAYNGQYVNARSPKDRHLRTYIKNLYNTMDVFIFGLFGGEGEGGGGEKEKSIIILHADQCDQSHAS